jgi:4-amino-4-deoxy-L-arabinose transferase-like glycosyltransferase
MIVTPHQVEGASQSEKSAGVVWCSLAAVALGVIILAAIRWSLDHPFGIHWDEAAYFDDVAIDVQRARGMMPLKLVGRILFRSYGHPPAYRLLALPFLTVLGFHTTVARLVSMACFILSSWFVYLATRRVASQAAAAFAVLIFCLSPGVVSGSIFYSTDAPLYLATAATLYYVLVFWSAGARRDTWIGLGLAIGLGFLAKTSFILIGLPVLALWLILSRFRHFAIEGLKTQWRAGALALVIAAPWWVINIREALAYGQYARAFVPNSLGPPSLVTWAHWFVTVVLGLVGPAISLLTGLLVITVVLQAVKRKTSLTLLQKVALGACACAGIPIVLAQLSGTNHLLRHISPAVIPLSIIIGLLSDNTGWIRSRLGVAASGVLLCAQLLMIVTPALYPNTDAVDLGLVNGALPWRVMARYDQWDWNPLFDISQRCGLGSPKIAVVGGGLEFNPPQIAYPWVLQSLARNNATVGFPNVTWLWRSDQDRAPDWKNIMNLARQSDIVLTAPEFIGEPRFKEDPDNRYNAIFADRLAHDSQFQGPLTLKMGRFWPIKVLVYLKKSLVCQSCQQLLLPGDAHL